MNQCQTSRDEILEYAISHQKHLIPEILGKRKALEGNVTESKFCIESYCKNYNGMDAEQFIEKNIS